MHTFTEQLNSLYMHGVMIGSLGRDGQHLLYPELKLVLPLPEQETNIEFRLELEAQPLSQKEGMSVLEEKALDTALMLLSGRELEKISFPSIITDRNGHSRTLPFQLPGETDVFCLSGVRIHKRHNSGKVFVSNPVTTRSYSDTHSNGAGLVIVNPNTGSFESDSDGSPLGGYWPNTSLSKWELSQRAEKKLNDSNLPWMPFAPSFIAHGNCGSEQCKTGWLLNRIPASVSPSQVFHAEAARIRKEPGLKDSLNLSYQLLFQQSLAVMLSTQAGILHPFMHPGNWFGILPQQNPSKRNIVHNDFQDSVLDITEEGKIKDKFLAGVGYELFFTIFKTLQQIKKLPELSPRKAVVSHFAGISGSADPNLIRELNQEYILRANFSNSAEEVALNMLLERMNSQGNQNAALELTGLLKRFRIFN